MKNEAKFEEELTCKFKIDMRSLTNFDMSIQKSQKWASFEQSLLFYLKKYRGVMFGSTQY